VKVALPFTMQLSKNKRTVQGSKSIKVQGIPRSLPDTQPRVFLPVLNPTWLACQP
jgi:hypothetical protein